MYVSMPFRFLVKSDQIVFGLVLAGQPVPDTFHYSPKPPIWNLFTLEEI